jgi:hypothetical protein
MDTFEARQLVARIHGAPGAPHKGLLVLLALSRFNAEFPRLTPYSEIAPQLGALLRKYYRPNATPAPDLPYWNLRNDGIWEVPGTLELERVTGKTKPLVSELEKTSGGFTPDFFGLLKSKPELVPEFTRAMLEKFIDPARHKELTEELALPN